MDLLVCKESLSCWKVHFQFNFNFWPDGLTLSSSTLWYDAELIVGSVTASCPVPGAVKQLQTRTFPPCFTLGMMFCSWKAICDLHQTSAPTTDNKRTHYYERCGFTFDVSVFIFVFFIHSVMLNELVYYLFLSSLTTGVYCRTLKVLKSYYSIKRLFILALLDEESSP